MISRLVSVLLLLVSEVPGWCLGSVIDFESAGGVAGDESLSAELKNGALLNASLALLKPGDTLVIPNKTFHVMGGVRAVGLRDATIRIDGTLVFSKAMDAWPRRGDGADAPVLECLWFSECENVTFTSGGVGTLDGQGATWWGLPGIGYLERGENRPRLFVHQGFPKDVLVEKLRFVNSPYWTFWVDGVDGLEVRDCHIDARRARGSRTHSPYELTAFNTGPQTGASMSLQLECLAIDGIRKKHSPYETLKRDDHPSQHMSSETEWETEP